MQAFVFPGQGSQKPGMGQDLFHRFGEFMDQEKAIDSLLGYSLRALCLEPSGIKLKETQFTQPALYTVNALHFLDKKIKGEAPALVAGHSLGEFDALFAAGVFDFITGLRLVARRGQLMSEVKNGAMTAVIGLAPAKIFEVLKENALHLIEIANYNSPEQTVISGNSQEIIRARPVLEKAGARIVIPLPVSAAFHSRHMESVARAFEAFLSDFEFHPPTVPVVANVTATLYPRTSLGIKSLLVAQIRSPVRWMESIKFILARGVSKFQEIGPGTVLTKFIQQISAHHQLIEGKL